MYDVTLIFKADYFHLLQQRLHHESRVSQEQVQNFLSSILLLSPVTFTQRWLFTSPNRSFRLLSLS